MKEQFKNVCAKIDLIHLNAYVHIYFQKEKKMGGWWVGSNATVATVLVFQFYCNTVYTANIIKI